MSHQSKKQSGIMSSTHRIALTTTAIIISGLSFLVFVTISKDILFGSLNFCSSSITELLLGFMALSASACVSGFMASLIVVRDNFAPHLVISMAIIGNLYLTATCSPWHAPFFYETGVHAAMVFALWMGHYGAKKFPLAPV